MFSPRSTDRAASDRRLTHASLGSPLPSRLVALLALLFLLTPDIAQCLLLARHARARVAAQPHHRSTPSAARTAVHVEGSWQASGVESVGGRLQGVKAFSEPRAGVGEGGRSLESFVERASVPQLQCNGSYRLVIGCLLPEPSEVAVQVVAAVALALRKMEAQNESVAGLGIQSSSSSRPCPPLHVRFINASQSNLLQTEAAALELLGSEPGLDALIGPLSTSQLLMVGPISTQLQVPLLAFSATDALAASNPQDPTTSPPNYVFRAFYDDRAQMAAIADIIAAYGWNQIITVSENTDFGRDGVQLLSGLLADKGGVASIVASTAVDTGASVEAVVSLLLQVNDYQASVFLMHFSDPPTISLVLQAAEQLGLFTKGYVWLATSATMKFVDALLPGSSALTAVEGLLGILPFNLPTHQLTALSSDISSYIYESSNSSQGILPEAVYAFDTLTLLSRATRLLRPPNTSDTSSAYPGTPPPPPTSASFSTFAPRPAGPALAEAIRQTVFEGASGQVGFSGSSLAEQFFVIGSVLEQGIRSVAFYRYLVTNQTTPDEPQGLLSLSQMHHILLQRNATYGLPITSAPAPPPLAATAPAPSTASPSSSSLANASQPQLQDVIWPGGAAQVPAGSFPKSSAPLQLAVPLKSGFEQFVHVGNNTMSTSNSNEQYTGFCIDVFKAAVSLLPYPLDYRFVPFGSYDVDPSYDALMLSVANLTYDGAVGDITITPDRSRLVDFTQPYQASGVTLILQQEPDAPNPWAFLQPFAPWLWLLMYLSFFCTAFFVWYLEHLKNVDFGSGRIHQQLATAVWFSFSTMVFRQGETVKTILGRITVLTWLFLIFVVSATYTASVSSALTVLQEHATVVDLADAITRNVLIGVQGGSFLHNFLLQYGVKQENVAVVPSGEKAYSDFLSSPETRVIVDEEPYADVLLSDYCNFTKLAAPFLTFNLGFAFPKGTALAADLSHSIEQLAQSGQLQNIHDLWLSGSGQCSSGPTLQSTSLGPASFWGLFVIYGAMAVLCCLSYAAVLIYRGHKAHSTREAEAAAQLERQWAEHTAVEMESGGMERPLTGDRKSKSDRPSSAGKRSRGPTVAARLPPKRLKSYVRRYRAAYSAGTEWTQQQHQVAGSPESSSIRRARSGGVGSASSHLSRVRTNSDSGQLSSRSNPSNFSQP